MQWSYSVFVNIVKQNNITLVLSNLSQSFLLYSLMKTIVYISLYFPMHSKPKLTECENFLSLNFNMTIKNLHSNIITGSIMLHDYIHGCIYSPLFLLVVEIFLIVLQFAPIVTLG